MKFAQVGERLIQHHLAPVSCLSLKARGVVIEWPILCLNRPFKPPKKDPTPLTPIFQSRILFYSKIMVFARKLELSILQIVQAIPNLSSKQYSKLFGIIEKYLSQ